VHDDPGAMRLSIQACMAMPVEGSAMEARVALLEDRFCNHRNAQRILDLLD
jgi:hypothetical protein